MKKFYKNLITGMAMICLAGSLHCFATDLTPGATASADKNYIHTLIPQTIYGSGWAMIEHVQYYDGLGRPCQSVAWQASPTYHDIVTPINYDVYGREAKKYLPYSGTGTYGAFANNDTLGQSSYYTGIYGSADGSNAFAKTEFEASPLNRVLKQGAPGATWQPNSTPSSDHSVKFDYGINGTSEVKQWKVINDVLTDNGYYDAKTLFKTTTWDENKEARSDTSHTEEFKDKMGKVVLKRSYNGTTALSTYYVYDEYELLRYVLPPKATEDNAITGTELDEFCYQYKYDGLKRMTTKRIPGADSISMVYDNRDRLVLSQDGTSRASGKWLFTKYDNLNRPVMTGYLTTGQTAGQLRKAFRDDTNTNMFETASYSGVIGYSFDNSFPSGLNIGENDILTITFYDNYSHNSVAGFSSVAFDSSNAIDSTYTDNDGNSNGYFDKVKGQITATKVKVLDTYEFTSSAKWLCSANYYSDKYRIIQTRRNLFDGSTSGLETTANNHDFTGRIVRTKLVQTLVGQNGTTTTVDKYYKYDHQGRLIRIDQEIAGDANGKVVVAQNIYNETGQLADKRLHKQGPYDFLQNVDYSYNIRGWLTGINNPDNLSGDLFGERLLYDTPESGLNVSTDAQFNGNISGMVWNSTGKSKQGYRFIYDGLNRLTLGDHKDNPSSWTDNNNYEEKSLTYDKNGNIGTLIRSDQYGNNTVNYSYSYNGNQLSSINNGTSYAYDLNGNTTTDGLRGMTIGYNVLNLPNSISKDLESIAYIYSANGEKLAKRMENNTFQYYAGNMVYNSDKSLNYILFEEGMVNKSSGAFTYEYQLKDHLGNTRVTFQPNGGGTTTTQVAEYYPFGSSYSPISPAGTNKYLYNGKEKQDDVLSGTALDLFDYGARFYDPMIGRWHVIDSKTEKYYAVNPYIYAINNPLMFIDKDGKDIYIFYGNENSYFVFNGKNASQAPIDAFVQNVIKAYNYDVKNGGGDNLKTAASNPKLHIKLVESKYQRDHYSPDQEAVFWDPYLAFEYDNGLRTSPATALEHEFDHAVDDQLHPKEHSDRHNIYSKHYENAEEERVITGSEAKTAVANGEFKKGQKGNNHSSKPYQVRRPETNNPDEFGPEKNTMSVEEFLRSILDANPNVKFSVN